MNLAILIAQRENWERLGDRFSGKQAEINYQELGVLALVLAGTCLFIWLLRIAAHWQEERTKRPNPMRLFNELSRAHHLSRWERRALRAMANATGARQPAEVFLRPEAFRPEQLPSEAAERPIALKQLRRKLFPELERA